MITPLGWVLGAILAAGIVGVIFFVGLIALNNDAKKTDPLDKESNFWW